MSWGSLENILDEADGYKNKLSKATYTQDKLPVGTFLPKTPTNLLGSEMQRPAFATRRASRHMLMGVKNNKISPTPGEKKMAPTDELEVEMQKFAAKGIDLEMVDDEEKQWKILEDIRAIPCPFRIRKGLKEKLFYGPVRGMSDCDSWKYHMARSWSNFKLSCGETIFSIEVWGGAFRSIEGHQGTGVLSYFVFLRWMFGLNFLLFLLMFGLITVPTLFMPGIDYSGTSINVAVNTSYYCTTNYTVTISTDVGQLVRDFIQGTGFMEKTLLFYGQYAVSPDTFVYDIPLAYYLVPLVCLLVSLLLMARYTARAFQAAILDEHDTGFEYTSTAFSSWDFSFNDEETAKMKHNSIYYDLQCDLAEERFQKDRAERMKDGCKRCCLYTTRILVNFFVLGCLGSGGYLIFYVTNWTSVYVALNTNPTGTDAYILLLVQYLPSLTITALNIVIPMMFDIVVKAEDYTQAFVVKITLIRTVFLRLASVAMLVLTIYTQTICQPRDGCLTNQSPCTVIQCWETYAGQQIYKLIIMNFLVTIIKIFLVEFPRRWIVKGCKAKLFQKIGPPTFNIPQNVLDLVYTQTLCWLGFFFAPLIPAMVNLHLFVVFYCKMVSALFACEPSKRPYKAARTNSFFMVVLLLAFFLCCVPVLYTISKLEPSKSCGPFRIYSSMYSVMDERVASWPEIIGSIYNLLTSVAVIVVIVILLALLAYYCSAMKNAHKEMTTLLRHQIALEGQDKHVLMTKIKELTGESTPLTRAHGRSKGIAKRRSPSVDEESADVPTPGKLYGSNFGTPKTPSTRRSPFTGDGRGELSPPVVAEPEAVTPSQGQGRPNQTLSDW